MTKSDLISRVKVWTIDFTRRNGFLGIFLLASWPNAAFDMCGMACGWLEMPFWTFFGATLLGKSLVKTTLQSAVCIWLFSPSTFSTIVHGLENVEALLPVPMRAGLGAKAAVGRQTIMRTFEMQNRLTLDELFGNMKSLSESALTSKYCAVATQCGVHKGGRWSDEDALKKVEAVVRRVFSALDTDRDGRLTQIELEAAVSSTDGRLSLGSLDPGSGGLLSPGNLWNGFIACLCLFFVLTIIDQVASSKQADLDEVQLAELEVKLRGSEPESKKES